MKWWYFVLLALGIVTISAAGCGVWFWTSRAKQEVRKPVPAPHVWRLVVLNLPGFRVMWKPVQSEDEVLGYRLKVWEIKGELHDYKYIYKSRHYHKDGFEYYEETREPQINETSKIGPTVIDVKGANTTEAVFGIAKQDVWYDLRVVAYTNYGESEASQSFFNKILSSKNDTAGNNTSTTPSNVDTTATLTTTNKLSKSEPTAIDLKRTNATEAEIGIAKGNILDLRKVASTKSSESKDSGTHLLGIPSSNSETAENDTTTIQINTDTTTTLNKINNMSKSEPTVIDLQEAIVTEAGFGVAKRKNLDLQKEAFAKSDETENSGTNMLRTLSSKIEATENDTTTTPAIADTTTTPTFTDTTTDNEFIIDMIG